MNTKVKLWHTREKDGEVIVEEVEVDNLENNIYHYRHEYSKNSSCLFRSDFWRYGKTKRDALERHTKFFSKRVKEHSERLASSSSYLTKGLALLEDCD